jgi:hypothetical protein
VGLLKQLAEKRLVLLKVLAQRYDKSKCIFQDLLLIEPQGQDITQSHGQTGTQ